MDYGLFPGTGMVARKLENDSAGWFSCTRTGAEIVAAVLRGAVEVSGAVKNHRGIRGFSLRAIKG